MSFCWPTSVRVLLDSIHSCNVIAKTCFDSLVLRSMLRILKTCPITFINNATFFFFFFYEDACVHPLLQDEKKLHVLTF